MGMSYEQKSAFGIGVSVALFIALFMPAMDRSYIPYAIGLFCGAVLSIPIVFGIDYVGWTSTQRKIFFMKLRIKRAEMTKNRLHDKKIREEREKQELERLTKQCEELDEKEKINGEAGGEKAVH